jgi:small subunit ribosomal protein S3
MASERKFVRKALADYAVKEYLEKELARAGVSKIELQKTPIATRIALFVRRPGVVVGKGGKTIQQVTEVLQRQYGIENPQLEVIEVENPALDPRLVAERVGSQIEIRGNAKRVARFALMDIMNAGALGAEIRIAGKIVGKGGKAKTVKVRAGFLKKSGEPMKLVQEGRYVAYPKAGAIGVKVRIVPPGTIFPDQIRLPDLATIAAAMPAAVAATVAAAAQTAAPTEIALPAEDEKAISEKLAQAQEAKAKRTRKKAAQKEVSEAGAVAQATGVAPKPEQPEAEKPAAAA